MKNTRGPDERIDNRGDDVEAGDPSSEAEGTKPAGHSSIETDGLTTADDPDPDKR
jgi:hypothetical protein